MQPIKCNGKRLKSLKIRRKSPSIQFLRMEFLYNSENYIDYEYIYLTTINWGLVSRDSCEKYPVRILQK